MHHPIQMKPADSEKNNGKFSFLLFTTLFLYLMFYMNSVHSFANDTLLKPVDSKSHTCTICQYN